MVEIKYEIVEKIAVLSESSPDHVKMGKGITLSDEEVRFLKQALDSRDI